MQKNQTVLIEQGAEAKIYKTTWNNKPAILKVRIIKSYRHPDLDKKITKERIQFESKNLSTALKLGIKVPQVYQVDFSARHIILEWIQGPKIKDYLNTSKHKQNIVLKMNQMGKLILKLHQNNIIHGDLTTSNMILKGEDIYLIDFGLSYIRNSVQDKAVDLYVLQRAFISTHPDLEKQFNQFYQGYTDENVIKRLQKVRARGRKKLAFG